MQIVKRTSMFKNVNIPFIWAIIIALILSGGCQEKATQSNILLVSILPQKYFVEQITGNQFQVEVMVPPGASPASYDPTPQQLTQLSKALLYFKIGYIGFEQTWIPKLESEYPDLPFIDCSKNVTFMEMIEDHSDHTHHGVEPHIWMSPKNARIIAKNIWMAVCDINPKDKDFYTANYNSLIEKIDGLDKFIHTQLDNLSKRSFIIYHPALTYFALEYNLEQFPIEKDGKEPSARYMEKIIQKAKEKEIQLIFIQKEFNQNEAHTLEMEINGKVVVIDPLVYNWLDQMKFITLQLSENLK